MRTRSLLPLILAFAGALAVAGCGSGDGGITDTEPGTTEPYDGPLVTYEKGGGFAPVAQSLEIEADGTGTATAEVLSDPDRGPKELTEEFVLADDELAELTEAVESTELTELDTNTMCADCFTYGITTANGSTDFDDAMLDGFGEEPPDVPDDVAALNAMLGELLDEHVPGPEAQAGA